MKTTTLLVSALALAFTFGTATAQTDTKPSKASMSLSGKCSKQATAKGLTGKERKAFYIKCNKFASAKKPTKAKASKAKTTKAKAA
jgi:psiF repeat